MKLPTFLMITFQNCIFAPNSSINTSTDSMSCPTLKSIIKYRRHSSITSLQDAYKGSSFSFSTVEKIDVIREIKHLSRKKVIQDDDIPVKILKETVNFFAEYIYIFYNYAIANSKFPSYLKMANVTPISRKGAKTKRNILDQSALFTSSVEKF